MSSILIRSRHKELHDRGRDAAAPFCCQYAPSMPQRGLGAPRRGLGEGNVLAVPVEGSANLATLSDKSREDVMLYLSKIDRDLWPLNAMHTRSGIPARTKRRIAERRRSCTSNPVSPARSVAPFHAS